MVKLSSPRVSVVLPTYNRAEELRVSVLSVLRQSFTDFELLVVDDASDVDIAPLLESFADSRVRLIKRSRNGGVAAARNSGLTQACGEYVAFQDSDDEWLLDKLEKQISVLDSEGSGTVANLCGIARYTYEGDMVRSANQLIQLGREPGFIDFLNYPAVYTQTCVVRRDVLTECGGFDETLKIWDDREMLLRISLVGRVSVCESILVVSGQTRNSLTVVNKDWVQDQRHILQKHRAEIERYPGLFIRQRYFVARLLAEEGAFTACRIELLSMIKNGQISIRVLALLMATFLPFRRWLMSTR